MKEIIKLGSILLVICLVAAAALGMTNEATIGKILEQREMANQLARQAVLPEAAEFEALDEVKLAGIQGNEPLVKEVYAGLKDGAVIGYVIKTGPNGFSGAVEVTTGISADGLLSGVRIGNHAETPGLGANATLPLFYEQFNGMAATQDIGVSKTAKSDTEILAITGATITSRAVAEGVNTSIRVAQTLDR
jgi:Na+-translocating ferredoxin:NAD+ oxidoreductase subunit G